MGRIAALAALPVVVTIMAAPAWAAPSDSPGQQTPYKNCKAAAADGRYNIPSSDPAYGPWLDRDGDGIACEKK